jgi:hypothetical protein
MEHWLCGKLDGRISVAAYTLWQAQRPLRLAVQFVAQAT